MQDVIRIRGHHLYHLAQYLRTGKVVGNFEANLQFKIEIASLFESIKTNSGIRIAVVSTLDSICEVCPIREDSCLNGNYQDNCCIKLSGLDKRRTYGQRKFVNILLNLSPSVLGCMPIVYSSTSATGTP